MRRYRGKVGGEKLTSIVISSWILYLIENIIDRVKERDWNPRLGICPNM